MTEEHSPEGMKGLERLEELREKHRACSIHCDGCGNRANACCECESTPLERTLADELQRLRKALEHALQPLDWAARYHQPDCPLPRATGDCDCAVGPATDEAWRIEQALETTNKALEEALG